MYYTSKRLQERFMDSIINMASAIGINCSITTDAGTKSFNVESGDITTSGNDQTVITKPVQINFDGLCQDVVMEYKKPIDELTFNDLYRRLSKSAWDNCGDQVYIGDDVCEKHDSKFNNWYVKVGKLNHQIIPVSLYARPNDDPYCTIFRCSIELNHLLGKCEISYSPAPITFPVNYCNHEFDMKTKIVDTNVWGVKFHDNDIMEKLKDKLISLAKH